MLDTMTNAWFYQLKAANRLLIKKNGGIEPSAAITSLSKTQIGRCHSDSDTELLPLPAQLRLEQECGDPVVTRAQAALHGCKLSDPREHASDGQDLFRQSTELGRLMAQYQSNAAIAFSDLDVTPNESRQAIKDLEAVMEKLMEMIRAHSMAIAAGGASVGKLRIVGEGA